MAQNSNLFNQNEVVDILQMTLLPQPMAIIVHGCPGSSTHINVIQPDNCISPDPKLSTNFYFTYLLYWPKLSFHLCGNSSNYTG